MAAYKAINSTHTTDLNTAVAAISLTIHTEAFPVSTEVELSNARAQIVDNTLHVIDAEGTPRYIQLL